MKGIIQIKGHHFQINFKLPQSKELAGKISFQKIMKTVDLTSTSNNPKYSKGKTKQSSAIQQFQAK